MHRTHKVVQVRTVPDVETHLSRARVAVSIGPRRPTAVRRRRLSISNPENKKTSLSEYLHTCSAAEELAAHRSTMTGKYITKRAASMWTEGSLLRSSGTDIAWEGARAHTRKVDSKRAFFCSTNAILEAVQCGQPS